ncbi:hypothetical protein EV189_1945 [Motilibacter rhizosphaerae]|uniref:Homoserine O-acetyltransferase n=1 Tax=Motilibacter rhizosphaerae TaxID=598652 RepID=A0A4Q7NUR2_9ACTN|nr:hypothetical protein [Motilibacter rhizosphaerae]RZS90162.1 hypothetical protein EV189_1945 [Motilibacter rhizosphaerae]
MRGTSTGLRVVRSAYGHDAFLLETAQVSGLVREALELAEVALARAPQSSSRRS